jgi:hypothetical protein
VTTKWSASQDEQVQEHELGKDRFWGRLVYETAGAAATLSEIEHEREDHIRSGLAVVEALAWTVNRDGWDIDRESPPQGWRHQSGYVLLGKKRGEPYIPILDVDAAAAAYLALPFRVASIDRLLTDMLMAAELFAFADESQPQLKQKLPIVLGWAWGNLKSLVCGLAIAGILFWIAPTSTSMQWIAGTIAGLTVLLVAFSVVLFPFVYPAARAQREKFTAVITGMTDAYRTLNGSPASVSHVRKLVDRATEAGVVWPAPLMALLDDINERRKSI